MIPACPDKSKKMIMAAKERLKGMRGELKSERKQHLERIKCLENLLQSLRTMDDIKLVKKVINDVL